MFSATLPGTTPGVPFVATTLPGTIQAANFDTGGEGVGYHKAAIPPAASTVNYRTGNVFIQPAAAGAGSPYDIGYIYPGDWLQYTDTVSTSGTYTVNFQVAQWGPGGTFHLDVDGVQAGGELTIPNTGGWQNWTTVADSGISLTAGQHVFRIIFDSSAPGHDIEGNLGSFQFVASGTTPTPPPATPLSTTTTLSSSANPANASQPVTFTATVAAATTPTGSVTFMDGSTALGTGALVNGVATLTTSSLAAGPHSITAVYGAASGYAGSTSAALAESITSTVVAPSPTITPTPLPGVLDADKFDPGTDGVSFHKTHPNTFPTLRPDTDVFVQPATDSGSTLGDGTDIGWIYPGDWVQYTTTLATAGTYTLNARVADLGSGGTFHINIDGVNATGELTLPNTGGWQNWVTVSAAGVAISAGTHEIDVVFDTSGNGGLVGNFEYLQLQPANTQNVLPPPANKYATTTTLSSSINPATAGQSVLFTATVASTGVPSGTVTFMDGSTVLGTGTLSNGVAIYTISSLSVATHGITAVYSGGANGTTSYIASTSAPVGEVVNAATIPTPPPTPTPTPVSSAPFIGIGLPGPDYYDANEYMNAVPGQFGQFGAAYNSQAGVPLANGSLDQNSSWYSQFVDYAAGQYTVTFTAPNPAAITVTTELNLSNLTNITINGDTWTATVTLTSSGAGMLNFSGASSSNEVAGLSVYAKGTNPAALTTAYSNLIQNYASLYTLNTDGVVGNQDTVTAADLPSQGASGYNEPFADGLTGNAISYQDLITQANSLPRLQNLLLEIPIGADNSVLQAIAQDLKSLRPGIVPIIAVGGETWNGGQAQYMGVANLAQTNPQVTGATSNQFTQVAYETAALDLNAVKEIRAISGNSQVTGFLVSQGSETAFVDYEKKYITSVMGLNLTKYFSYQGVSFYPDDNLTSAPSTPAALYSDLMNDLPRQLGYLKADVADAHASGLHEIIYEFGLTGELTQSGISLSTLQAFNASTYATQWATNELNAAMALLGSGDGLEVFTGGYWGPQPDTAAPVSNEQAVIDQDLLTNNPLT